MMDVPSRSRVPPAERLGEVADILAVGLIRMRARMSSPFLRNLEKFCLLDSNAQQSGPQPNSPADI
jgi:hypothetical protein